MKNGFKNKHLALFALLALPSNDKGYRGKNHCISFALIVHIFFNNAICANKVQ